MITPQNVIQLIDQKPVPAPMPHAANASPADALHTVIARMIVMMAPIVTACHADIFSAGSTMSSTTMGTSAISVLPSVEWAGSSDWVNGCAAASEVTALTMLTMLPRLAG